VKIRVNLWAKIFLPNPSLIRSQSAGTALFLFKKNPADELSSEAEQLIRHL